MVKNNKAIVTLIRNKLNRNESFESKRRWFAEKGIRLTHKDDLFFLRTNTGSLESELTQVCNGLIFRNNQLLAYPGRRVRDFSLEEAKKLNYFIWNKKTYYIEYLKGKVVYMFWDEFLKDWNFSEPNKHKTPYKMLLKNKLYNIMSAEPFYTYQFVIIESGPKSNIYLETMYNNLKLKEEDWELTYKFSIKLKASHPNIYKFEGFDKIEEKDLPLYAKDRNNKILIKSLN